MEGTVGLGTKTPEDQVGESELCKAWAHTNTRLSRLLSKKKMATFSMCFLIHGTRIFWGKTPTDLTISGKGFQIPGIAILHKAVQFFMEINGNCTHMYAHDSGPLPQVRIRKRSPCASLCCASQLSAQLMFNSCPTAFHRDLFRNQFSGLHKAVLLRSFCSWQRPRRNLDGICGSLALVCLRP